MNQMTKIVTLPLLMGSFLGLWLLFSGQVSWWAPLIGYFFFGVLINGTIAHRYFAHNNFWVPGPVRWLFGISVVIGGYGLPLIWVMQHRHHHRHSDDANDLHAPHHGFWHAFIGWRCEVNQVGQFGEMSQFRKTLKDPVMKFTTKYYFPIIYSWFAVAILLDWQWFLAGYCVGVMLDHIRLGLVNTLCHMPNLPGNYANYDTKDFSQNNLLLGWLGGGFGWHNNHHRNATRLILTKRWWEIDIEGYMGWLIGWIFSPMMPKASSSK